MNYPVLSAIALALFFVSCKNADKNNDSAEAAIVIEEKQKLTDPVFFKTLEGNIGTRPVVMHLLKTEDRMDVNYYYVDQGQTIFLIPDWEKESEDSIYLLEVTNPLHDESPRLVLRILEDGVAGTWSSADKKISYPVDLKVSAADSGWDFTVLNITDSSKYLKFQTDTPMLRTTVTTLVATGQNERVNWLNGQLKKIVDAGNSSLTNLSLPQTVMAIVKKDVEDYQSDADSSLVGVNIQGPHFFLNREYEKRANLIYNRNGYTVVSFFNYAYTGGAHGNYSTSVYCFDADSEKQLSLGDIITIDSSQFQHLLERNYRKQYGIPETTPIEERLFVNRIVPNDNFYFSQGGLGFIYNPYEIASYADGEINIWIPFAELKPYLNPHFAQRMHL